jgi:hypothetical protein
VAKEELDLLQFTARTAAQSTLGPPQIASLKLIGDVIRQYEDR